MTDFIFNPWPWYVSGPLIGAMVPLLLLMGNKKFGVSSSFRTACAMCLPGSLSPGYLKYNWKEDVWNIFFAAGIIIGGYIGYMLIGSGQDFALSDAAMKKFSTLGITDFRHLLPSDFFSWHALNTWKGILRIIVGGLLIGFGTRYADGCTSGHAIYGLGTLQWPSLVAVMSFFVGGLIAVNFLFPLFF